MLGSYRSSVERATAFVYAFTLYVVHPRCVYAIDGRMGPSNTTATANKGLLYPLSVPQ
jgi:hypothetical protein